MRLRRVTKKLQFCVESRFVPSPVVSTSHAFGPQLDKEGGGDSLFVTLAVARMWQSQDVESGLSAPKSEFLTTGSASAYIHKNTRIHHHCDLFQACPESKPLSPHSPTSHMRALLSYPASSVSPGQSPGLK